MITGAGRVVAMQEKQEAADKARREAEEKVRRLGVAPVSHGFNVCRHRRAERVHRNSQSLSSS